MIEITAALGREETEVGPEIDEGGTTMITTVRDTEESVEIDIAMMNGTIRAHLTGDDTETIELVAWLVLNDE